MDWQPIETAQKDNSQLLLYNIETDCMAIGWWDSFEKEWVIGDDGIGYMIQFENPTHWKSRPQPPTT